MIESDVCIVGGGVMGLAAAYWLGKEARLKTVLVEQYAIGNDYCSSNDVNRVFRYAYGADKLYTRMAVESLELWRRLEKEIGLQFLVETGLLMVEGDDEESNKFNHDSFKLLEDEGLGAEQLDETDTRRMFPQFSSKEAYLDPHGGVLVASRILTALRSRASAAGVRIIENSRVTALEHEPQSIVTTVDGQTVKARRVVVTAGPWSNKFRGEPMVSMTPTRQQVAYFKPRKGLNDYRPEKFPVFFADHYYGLPAVGVDGVKISHKGLWDPVQPESAKWSVDPDAVDACRNVCKKFIPGLTDAEVVRTKVCLYDMTENSDFVVGPDPDHPDFVYGYGFSGHGFKFAPLIGRLLAELALDRPLSFDISRFSPESKDRGSKAVPY